jgi:hypothetical protein
VSKVQKANGRSLTKSRVLDATVLVSAGDLKGAPLLAHARHLRGARGSTVMRRGRPLPASGAKYRDSASEKALLLLVEFLVGQKP